MRNKGFTLIELLAVIIILAILLVIAIPSITMYISDSRKEVYVNTGKELVKGASILVTKNKIDVDDPNTTYYIPYTCISVDGKDKASSPYGDFEDAYVVVTVDNDNKYDYYFYSKDTQGFGVYPITEEEALSAECIKSGVESISTNIGIGKRKNIKVYSSDCTYIEEEKKATQKNPEVDEHGNIITIDAVFDTGSNVSRKMRTLSGSYDGSQYSFDKQIKYIKKSSEEPTDENKQSKNIVSSSSSKTPIYMWFDSETGTIYWYSEDATPSFNADASNMFGKLTELISIEGLEDFDTSLTTNMESLFKYCLNVIELDLSNFDTSNVTNMSNMFFQNKKLTYLDLSGFDTSEVTNMCQMFYELLVIPELDVSSFDTSKVTSMFSMFAECKKIKTLDLSNFDVSKVTDFGAVPSRNGIGGYGMFSYCTSLKSIDLSNFNTESGVSFAAMFYNCISLEHLDLKSFNTSNMTNAQWMFEYCYKLKTLDVSSFDTSKCEVMDSMFRYCQSLEELDVSNFNTSSCTYFRFMFSACESLKIIDVGHFDTSKCEGYDMTAMFSDCYSVKTIIVTNFDTSKVDNFGCMFYHCHELENVDLSSFDTRNIKSIDHMFFCCYKLKTIDLSMFDTPKLTSMISTFVLCRELTTIYVSDTFDVSKVTSTEQIFAASPKLRGGEGSKYTYSLSSDLTYAHIDEGPSNPGLFTRKV